MLVGATQSDSVQPFPILDNIPPRGVEDFDVSGCGAMISGERQKSRNTASNTLAPGSTLLESTPEPALAVVVGAWPHLPEAARRQILTVVRQASVAAQTGTPLPVGESGDPGGHGDPGRGGLLAVHGGRGNSGATER